MWVHTPHSTLTLYTPISSLFLFVCLTYSISLIYFNRAYHFFDLALFSLWLFLRFISFFLLSFSLLCTILSLYSLYSLLFSLHKKPQTVFGFMQFSQIISYILVHTFEWIRSSFGTIFMRLLCIWIDRWIIYSIYTFCQEKSVKN